MSRDSNGSCTSCRKYIPYDDIMRGCGCGSGRYTGSSRSVPSPKPNLNEQIRKLEATCKRHEATISYFQAGNRDKSKVIEEQRIRIEDLERQLDTAHRLIDHIDQNN